jgi:hypothetical protein
MCRPVTRHLFKVLRRFSVWLTIAIAGNALVWLCMLNHRASFRLDVPQYFFGVRIGGDLSMALVMLELAGIPFFGVLLVITLVWALVRRLRRAQSPPTGLCLVCGYDLRATPERCPECGAIPSVDSIDRQQHRVRRIDRRC